jgi:hypothetical protein
MVQLEPTFEPHSIEEEARGIWKSRQLPPAGGMLGPRSGSVVLQFEGSFTPGESQALIAHRAVAADIDARYLALAGRRALGTLRYEPAGGAEAVPRVAPLLEGLGVWTGGNGSVPWDQESRHARIEALVGRLARRGVVVSRDLPMRACPTCAEPRSPERIIYQEEEGDTYIVRFDLPHDGKVVHAMVWVDAPWRLLGTSALLVHPDLPYVIARYRRKESEELVFTSRSSIERFRTWIPGGTFEVLEEHPGRFFEGRVYDYPLRHEFPTGGGLAAPAGTVVAVPDVTDTGTGVVPLVPGHGSTDALIAESRGVAGWPLVTPRGQLDLTLMHKYSGLDLRSGSEFILRDLTEGGSLFATLKVRRGVPHCAVCGSALLWLPGRAWCLEPSRFPAERLEQYRRLLPGAPPLDRIEVAPWPISDLRRSDDPVAVALLECARCERLEPLDGPVACPCGGHRYPARRLLVPSAAGALAAWSRLDPFPLADSVHLYVGERRLVPVVVHHLMAMSALEGGVGDVELTRLPTVSDVALAELISANGADAVRAAFVRASSAEGASGSLADHCRVERGRLARLSATTKEVLALCDPGMLASFAQPVGGFMAELEAEDRALLARWERTRVLALADYDHWDPASVYRRVVRFLENDLAVYLDWVRPRLALTGSPATKRGALRALVHVLRQATVALGPIVPHLSEVIYRQVTPGRTSLFEGTIAAVDRTLINDELSAAWDRWRSLVDAITEFRRAAGLRADTLVPSAALVVAEDELGARLRADRPILERLARVGRVDVGSPREPWEGRQRRFRPVESEIQRLYPSQASQIVHLLRRSAPRRTSETGPSTEFSVVIQGMTLRVLPSMVESVEMLPPGVLPCRWGPGEMYLEIPAGAKPPDRVPPPISTDAFWLVRRLERRLRRSPPPPPDRPRTAIVQAAEPLASDLRLNAEALAQYLGLAELKVVPTVQSPPPRHRITGRTRTGAPWWVEVPGWSVPSPRAKRRPARPKCRRVPEVGPAAAPPEVDFAADDVVARWESVRALGIDLDGILGAPLLGPTKVSSAWDQGLSSVDAYRHASFEQLEDLPGFGRTIAALLVEKFGGVPPPPRARPRPRPTEVHPPGNGERRPTVVAPPTPSVVPMIAPAPSLPPPPVRSQLPIERMVKEPPAPPPERTILVTAPPPATEPPREITPQVPAPPPIMENVPVPEEEPEALQPPTESASALETTTVPQTPPEETLEAEAPSTGGPAPELGTVELPPEPLPVEVSPAPAEPPIVEGELPAPGPAPAEVPPEVSGSQLVLESVPETPVPGPAAEPAPPMSTEATPAAIGPVEAVPQERPVETSAETEPTPTAPEPVAERVEARAEGIPPALAAGTAPPPTPPEAAGSSGAAASTESFEPVARPTLEEEVPKEPMTGAAALEATAVEPAVALESVPGTALTPKLVVGPTPEVAPPPPVAVPAVEAPPPTPKPPPAGIEIMLGPSLLSSIQPFLDATAAGHRGICLVRESPERVAAQVGSRPATVYWLSNLGRGKTLRPTDLQGIFTFLAHAAEAEHVMVFFIEGLEYLTRIHGAEAVVERLAEFDRVTKELDARVWIHLTAALLPSDDLAKLLGRFGPAVDSS